MLGTTPTSYLTTTDFPLLSLNLFGEAFHPLACNALFHFATTFSMEHGSINAIVAPLCNYIPLELILIVLFIIRLRNNDLSTLTTALVTLKSIELSSPLVAKITSMNVVIGLMPQHKHQ